MGKSWRIGQQAEQEKRIRHARRRFYERFGVDISLRDYKELVRRVKGGGARFIRKGDASADVYLVTWRDSDIPVVYNHRAGLIVTFLPLPPPKQKD